MTRVKFCGLMGIADALAARECVPDFAGFVFAKSRRQVSESKAVAMREILGKIPVVGVFANERTEVIAGLADRGVIDIIQLHGSEDEKYISELRSLTDKKIIKAFAISDGEQLKRAEGCSADFLLFDSPKAGSGKTFDWEIISMAKREFFLAGGLNESNVKSAVDRLSPYAVDVSSGIESNGKKDIEKMKKFLSAVRGKGEIL